MDAPAATADAEHTAGTLTDHKVLLYLAEILRVHGSRPLNMHGTTFGDDAIVSPGHSDAIIVAEKDAAYLRTTVEARELWGWPQPSVRVILQLGGVNRARCLLGPPVGQGVYDVQTKRVRSFQAFVDALP
ncbi:hypothetical protein C8R46DRAFT_1035434 [Mycena filopes]|nr:hypothetical protein C8R46DRAFT_1035434 [Mycena filopes]